MSVNMSGRVKEIVTLFLGAFLVFVLASALFPTVDNAVTTFAETLTNASHPAEAAMVGIVWNFIILGLLLGILGFGVKYILDAVKGI
jgi:hypothetical protein